MENKQLLIKVIFGLIILIIAYFVMGGFLGDLTKKDVANNEDENTTVETHESDILNREKMIEDYRKEKAEKIKKLTKKDLYGEVVGVEEYGIIDDAPTVNIDQLLPTDTWEKFLFNEMNLIFRYPSDQPKKWWVQKNGDGNHFVMTTSQSSEPSDWAKITFGLYERTPDQSIFDWMEASLEKEGVEMPPSDRTTQYVTIGESKFLGSIFFKDHIWTGQKNVYAELDPTLVFAASLEVQNSKPDSDLVGKFDQVFYTMLESLEVKPQ
jgi:hypothetical protein